MSNLLNLGKEIVVCCVGLGMDVLWTFSWLGNRVQLTKKGLGEPMFTKTMNVNLAQAWLSVRCSTPRWMLVGTPQELSSAPVDLVQRTAFCL